MIVGAKQVREALSVSSLGSPFHALSAKALARQVIVFRRRDHRRSFSHLADLTLASFLCQQTYYVHIA